MTEVFSFALPGILLGAVFIGAAYLVVLLLKERGGGGEAPDCFAPEIQTEEEERGDDLEILMREFHALRCAQVTATERTALMHLSTAIQRMRRGEDVPGGVIETLLLDMAGGERVLRKLWGEEL